MQTTNEKRAYSAKSRPANATNGRKPTTLTARGASPSPRFGLSVGETIIIALAFNAAARLAGGGR